jgi:hypothetical protein
MSLFPVSFGMRPRVHGLLIVATLSLVACGSTDQPKPVRPPVTIETPGRHLITVKERDAGATIVLDAAQELLVRLPLDSMEVTAGLDWLLVDVKPEVLSNAPSKFEVTGGRDYNPDGLGGDVMWRFAPQREGSTPLRFELRRVHSLDPPIRTATYVVRVK